MQKTETEVNNLTAGRIDKNFFKKIVQKTLSLVKFCVPQISIVVVGDAKMKSLNKQYKKKDRITDVLAFDYGEIIICLTQAKRQAKLLGHSLKKELGILLIHGLLHLKGYDDQTEQQRQRMTKIQEEIFLKIKNSLR